MYPEANFRYTNVFLTPFVIADYFVMARRKLLVKTVGYGEKEGWVSLCGDIIKFITNHMPANIYLVFVILSAHLHFSKM